MDDKAKKIIQRYVDGEKTLMSKLEELHSSLDSNDNDVYASFLRSLMADDDFQKIFMYKKEIQKDISHKGLKPNFPKKSIDVPKTKIGKKKQSKSTTF